MRTKILLTASMLALVTLAFIVGGRTTPAAPAKSAPVEANQARPTLPPPEVVARAAAAPEPDSDKADPRIVALHNEADLGVFLESLEKDAEKNGASNQLRAAALAGKQMDGKIDADRLSTRMRAFGEHLHRIQQIQQVKPALDQLDALAVQIAAEHEPAARRALLARYDTIAQQLPPAYRLDAQEKLKSAVP